NWNQPMQHAALIDQYAAGPKLVREATAGMTREQLLARPVPGNWSTLQVVCHLADFEIVGADRIKRVIAEDKPTLPDGDEKLFASRLAYDSRELETELRLIEACRAHVTQILRQLKDHDFSRVGNHTTAGPLTLLQLLERTVKHLPHHV